MITPLLLFLVLDNFTLYWYMLFNGDDALERRRQGAGVVEDSGYVDPSVDGTGTNGSNLPNGGNGNYGQTGMLGRADLEAMSPEDAVAAVTRTLTDEQIKDPETAWRVFIYLMDRHGFVPNAIIGAMSYVKAEGAGMGTFTYESYWLCPGPDGAKSSRHLGNQDWLDWLNGPGFKWAEANYGSRREDGENLHYAAIGIGSVQSSDVWDGPGNKTTSNATQLIEAANAKGLYWQDPGFQMPNLMTRYFVSSEPFGKSAWDVDHCPGVDPTTDNNVTAFEWSKRVLCGVGYPGWKSCSMSDDNKHVVSHAAGIEECAGLYEKYSKKDPWFYTDGSGANDWHNPFAGPAYDNTTAQGLMIARCAVMLAGRDRTQQPQLMRVSADNSYSNPEMAADPGMQYYREAKMELESTNNYFASCDRAATLAIMLAGVDTTWTSWGGCSTLISHCDNSDAWQYMGKMSDVQMQPGDVLFKRSDGGHIAIWVGDNVAGERFPGTTANIYQASLDDAGSPYAYFADLSNGNPKGNYWGSYRVYRCVNPSYSGDKWTQFISGRGSKFSELNFPWSKTTTQNYTAKPGSQTGANLDGNWVLPIDCVVTSQFGTRVLNGETQFHRAYDFRAPEGTSLSAPVAGTVIKVVDGRDNQQGASGDASWGNYIKLEHLDGKVTLYAHLKKGSLLVSEGDKVAAGQAMAQTGNTGNSYGAHLHLELWPDRDHGSNTDMLDCLQLFPGLTYTDINDKTQTVTVG